MRGAATALAVIFALAAHAQTPPDTPAAPPAQAPAPTTPPPDAGAGEGQPPPESQSPADTPAPSLSPPRETGAAPIPRASTPHALSPHPLPAAPAPAAATDNEAELARLRAEVSRLQSELDAERAAAALPAVEENGAIAATVRGAWGWVLAAALLALAAGFVLGWRVLDRRIRRKYGGLRIY